MESRATLLIKRELDRIRRFPLWGVEVRLNSADNLFVWKVKLRGLRHTIWEAGVFHVMIQFSPEFNLQPPNIWFHTIPFHPNIDMSTGRPCMSVVDTWWSELMTMSAVLLTMQELLSNPIVDEAVNEEAASAFLNSPDVYTKLARDCIQASIRVNAGLPPFDANQENDAMKSGFPEPHVKVEFPRNPSSRQVATEAKKRTERVAYDDYHLYWTNVATSHIDKPHLDIAQEKLKQFQDATTKLFTEEELKEHLQRQLEQHTAVMYGKFTKPPGGGGSDSKKVSKMEKVEMMKKVYLKQKAFNTPLSTARESTMALDDQADELLAWADGLQESAVDDI
jgi:ubiquitin-conjugating enzyme E2 U